mmetsp:Transcript_11587/g.39579  ORF Transcript_11587/g.39579 Transcript_11587/m.39579 type:complete len:174 (+) Transcript_11587:75-596(+)
MVPIMALDLSTPCSDLVCTCSSARPDELCACICALCKSRRWLRVRHRRRARPPSSPRGHSQQQAAHRDGPVDVRVRHAAETLARDDFAIGSVRLRPSTREAAALASKHTALVSTGGDKAAETVPLYEIKRRIAAEAARESADRALSYMEGALAGETLGIGPAGAIEYTPPSLP